MSASRRGQIPSNVRSFTPHPLVQALGQQPAVHSLRREFALVFSKAPDVNNNSEEMGNRPGPMKAIPSPAKVPTVLTLLVRLS